LEIGLTAQLPMQHYHGDLQGAPAHWVAAGKGLSSNVTLMSWVQSLSANAYHLYGVVREKVFHISARYTAGLTKNHL